MNKDLQLVIRFGLQVDELYYRFSSYQPLRSFKGFITSCAGRIPTPSTVLALQNEIETIHVWAHHIEDGFVSTRLDELKKTNHLIRLLK